MRLFLPQNPRPIQFLRSMASSASVKIVAEYAKSNRSSCKKCTKMIGAAALRLGLATRDPRGFESTKWHHLHCFPINSNPLSSAESIKGFSQLKGSDQETLKKLVSEGNQSPEKSEEDAETDAEERNRKKQKVSDGEADAVGGRKARTLKCCKSDQHEDQKTELEEENPKKEKSEKEAKAGPEETNRKKRMVSDGDAEAVEGRRKESILEHRKISDAAKEGGEEPIAFSISGVKNKYKDAKLLPKWKAFQTIIFLERDDGLQDSRKIAAFDFDGCLAKTSLQRVGADAWSLMYPSIPEKLQSLYKDGYKLVIFTNEANIDRWKVKRQKAVDSKIGRLNGFIKKVKVPVQVFIACGSNSGQQEDPFRKPKPGMWHIMEQQFNSGIQIDRDQSFYVGDAAGRLNDHSDADIKFAQAIGVKFYLPEDYFTV